MLPRTTGTPIRVNWTDSTGNVTVYYNPGSYSTPTDFTVGNGRFDVPGGAVLTTYMLVNSLANFQSMVDPGAAPTTTRSAGTSTAAAATFNPLTFTFTGIFDGLNHTSAT